jgi:ABC-type antimicrobial peptide transport system permease subunit
MKSYRHCFQHMLLALFFGIPVGCLTGALLFLFTF